MLKGELIFPFVFQFHDPSTHLWEDEEGVVHAVNKELFAVGHQQALEAIEESFQPLEMLMALTTCTPERTATVEQSVEVNFWSHAPVNQKKTQLENR